MMLTWQNELKLIVIFTENPRVPPILLQLYANHSIRAYKYLNPYEGTITEFIAGGTLSTSILNTGEAL